MEPIENLGLSWSERLRHKKLIDALFDKSRSLKVRKHPLLMVFVPCELQDEVRAQALFSVGKKKFKSAVRRNRIKRMMRELYRLHKAQIYKSIGPNRQLAIGLMYLDVKMPDYAFLENQFQFL